MDLIQNPDDLSMMDMDAIKAEMLANFECQKSGNCCKCPGVVYATQKEISKMAESLEITSYEFRQDYVVKKNGWDVIADEEHRPNCFLNEDNRCLVYPGRPEACRTYPDWPSIWESKEAVLKECQICPGLNKALKKVLKDFN